MSKEEAIEWISQNDTRIIEISDKIWEFAEVGLQEFKSSALLADELEKAGFKVERGVAGMPTAFVATWGSGEPIIGILGEYDALPGMSQKIGTQKEPLEEGKPGHGCGHNIFGAAGASAAIATKYVMEKSNIKGTVKFFGCPAEETLVGKVFMVREGLFDNLSVVLSYHPWVINTTWDASSLAMNSIKFTFHGVAAHAAANPDQGKSALDAVELMNTGVNFLREHIIQEARVHYVITDGGGEPNVVPPKAQSWYYIRAPKRDQVESIYNRIQNIAKGAALMTDTTFDEIFLVGCHEMLPNIALGKLMIRNMKEIGFPEYTNEELEFAKKLGETLASNKKAVLTSYRIPDLERRMEVDLDSTVSDPIDYGAVLSGSTDVGDVSWKAPTANLATNTWVLGTPSHTWQAVVTSGMSIGHKSLVFATKTLAATAIDLLTRPDELKKIRDEFAEKTKSFTYKSPLPPDLKPPLDQLPKH